MDKEKPMFKTISDTKLQDKINWKPHKGQIEVLNAFKTKRDITICAGRRWGKSAICAYLVLRTLLADNQEIAVISPSYDLTERILDYLKLWLHKGFPSSPRFQTRPFPKIEMSWNSYVEGKSAEFPIGILGKGYNLVIVDEASRISKKIYQQFIYPALTSKQGKTVFISTPLGKNWFYDKYVEAKESDDGQEFHFTSKDSPYFTLKEWKRAEDKLPEDTFRQEFQAVFGESSASVFRGIKECIDLNISKDVQISHKYQMGVDVAKFRDFTVITVIDTNTTPYQLVHLDRFQKIPYTLIKQRIFDTAIRFNKAKITMDSLNAGAVLIDELRSMGLNITPFTATGTISKDQLKKGSKERIIEKLSSFIESREISFPAIEVLIDELESYGYIMSDAGNVKYGAVAGKHDDCVDSLGLAIFLLETRERLLKADRRKQEYGKIRRRSEETKYARSHQWE